jgi:hypothetical protein
VTSRMALHHVEHLDPVLAMSTCPRAGRSPRAQRRAPGDHQPRRPVAGRRTSWVVDEYFVRGPRVRPWFGGSVTWYHRTVEDHVRALAASGLVLGSLQECEPRDRLLARRPGGAGPSPPGPARAPAGREPTAGTTDVRGAT